MDDVELCRAGADSPARVSRAPRQRYNEDRAVLGEAGRAGAVARGALRSWAPEKPNRRHGLCGGRAPAAHGGKGIRGGRGVTTGLRQFQWTA